MPNFNIEELYDRINGCWIGKNIGGTLGTPFEGGRELLDISGFTSPEGQALPNDDLDLQLIWLKALQDKGPLGVNEQVLGEYWINFIPPHWNEYGIGKCNMKAGLLPPLSGDHANDWKHSNGAWIRSEIWACVAPGCPDIATEYGWCDACVDHGGGEGTYAEIFTTAVQSAAFVEHDRDKLIELGLARIPADCRVARSIRIVLDAHAEGVDWKTARERVLQDSADLGWFQAPANVAFVIIGWMYGEGDFKKSLIIATNCGDDTDCTAATLGATLGILYGAKALPKDWQAYIGDGIVTVAIDRGSCWVPRSCTELTEQVMQLTPQVLAAKRTGITVSEKPTDLSDFRWESLRETETSKALLARKGNTVRFDYVHTRVELCYETGASVKKNGEARLTVTLYNQLPDPRHVTIRYHLPDCLTLTEGPTQLVNFPNTGVTTNVISAEIRLQAAECVQATMRGFVEIVAVDRPTMMLVPIVLLGE